MDSAAVSIRSTILVVLLLAPMLAGARGDPLVRESHAPDGALLARWHVRVDENGEDVRHGRLRRFHANGSAALEAWYRDGQPVGVWQWWDEKGYLLRSERYEYGMVMPLRGEALERPEVTYRRLDGTRTAEGLMKGDRPHGQWQFWYPDGSPRANGEYRTGIPHGRWAIFHPDGQLLREAHYQMGVLHGDFREGYPNGQEMRRGHIDQGLKQGLWRYWFPNGAVRAEGRFIGDLQDGEWRYWDPQGNLIRRATYRAGELLDVLEIPPQLRKQAPIVVTEDDLGPPPRLFDELGEPIDPLP